MKNKKTKIGVLTLILLSFCIIVNFGSFAFAANSKEGEVTTGKDKKTKYVVGFSQATITEPWRLLFNKELRIEADKYPEIELLVRDGLDDANKQISDVEEFISRKVDAILISPKVAQDLTPIVNKAMDQGIPVIVLDRDLSNKKYTQFIGGDNKLIGRTAGEYALKRLGGKGAAKGNIIEIWGGMAATPAQDRHAGFAEAISGEKGIKNLIPPTDGDWKQDLAYDIMSDALDKFDKIDLVYAHNDPMAYGAFLAAKDMGREKNIMFLGIDAIPAEGIKWVYQGNLTATFLYMTPGAEGIRQAMKLLKGEKIAPNVVLPTMVIDSSNAAEMLKKNGLL